MGIAACLHEEVGDNSIQRTKNKVRDRVRVLEIMPDKKTLNGGGKETYICSKTEIKGAC